MSIDAESTDVEGIEREFRLSIDVYLEGCAELGIEPVAPTPVPIETEVSCSHRTGNQLKSESVETIVHPYLMGTAPSWMSATTIPS